MTQEAQRIAMAELEGWSDFVTTGGTTLGTPKEWDGMRYQTLPDYLSDLNAVARVEGKFNSDYEKNTLYANALRLVVLRTKHSGCDIAFAVIVATASQRVEAILRTVGKWTE